MNSYGLDQPLDLRLKALNLSRTFNHEPAANYYQASLSIHQSINQSSTVIGAHCQNANNCSTNNPLPTSSMTSSQILNPPCFNQLYHSQHNIHHPLRSFQSSEPSSHQQQVIYPYQQQHHQQNHNQATGHFRSANIHCQPLNHLQPHPLSRLHPPPSHLQSLRAPVVPPPPPPPPTQAMSMNHTSPHQIHQTSASSSPQNHMPNTTTSSTNSGCFSQSPGQQSPKNYTIHNNTHHNQEQQQQHSNQVMSVEASAAAAAAAMAAAARLNGQLTPPHQPHQHQANHHHHQHPYHHHQPVPVRSLSMSSHILSSSNQLSSMIPPTLTPPMSHNQNSSNAGQCFGASGTMRQTSTNKGDLSQQRLTKQMGSTVGGKPLSSSYDSGISTSLSASNSNSSSGFLTATVSATNMSTTSNSTITTTTTKPANSTSLSTTTTNSCGTNNNNNNNNNNCKTDRNNINNCSNSDDNNPASPITRQHSLVSRYNCKPCGIVFSQPETLRAHQEGYCTKRDRNQTAQMRSQSAVSPSAIKNVNNSNSSNNTK